MIIIRNLGWGVVEAARLNGRRRLTYNRLAGRRLAGRCLQEKRQYLYYIPNYWDTINLYKALYDRME